MCVMFSVKTPVTWRAAFPAFQMPMSRTGFDYSVRDSAHGTATALSLTKVLTAAMGCPTTAARTGIQVHQLHNSIPWLGRDRSMG